jgi:predicted short-subunit dehydrogenase-like oxidoreductase (DUF2520 family)
VLDHTQRAFALVGPGRAGTTLAVALRSRGWVPRAVAGRAPGDDSVSRVAALLGVPARAVAEVAADADLVVIATPDAAIAETAAALAPGLRAGALVLHVSGACTLDELDKLRVARPDVAVGSLHPLQSLPSVAAGVARLPGSWCAVDGPPDVERIALSLGMRPFRIADTDRVIYHAAAAVASNHLVALLAQAGRLAECAGVPPAALVPLARATLDNVERHGARDALTGPVARGDVDTVRRHLAELSDDEAATYRALASEALRLSGRDDRELAELLRDGL